MKASDSAVAAAAAAGAAAEKAAAVAMATATIAATATLTTTRSADCCRFVNLGYFACQARTVTTTNTTHKTHTTHVMEKRGKGKGENRGMWKGPAGQQGTGSRLGRGAPVCCLR